MDASGAAPHRDIPPSHDYRVIGLISVIHAASHVYHVALPALFLLINQIEGLSFTQLGLLSTVFFAASGVFQTPAGFLVDRVGARPVLLGGLILEAGAFALIGVAPSYPAMIALSFLAGLGNSIFHPADISILTGSVSPVRMGRAFSIHYLGGFIGYAVTPITMVALGSLLGWRGAVIAMGLVGMAGAAVLCIFWRSLRDDRDAGRAEGRASGGSIRKDFGVLLQAPTILSFVFFAFMAMASVGLMQFGAPALSRLFDMGAEASATAISVYLFSVLGGVMAGGLLADRTRRHDTVAAISVAICVVLLLIVSTGLGSAVWLLLTVLVAAGVGYGVSCPMRDMVVRSVAPRGAAGKVFGFTYSGMDFGSATTGVVMGILLDHGMVRTVFICFALFMALAVVSILAAKATGRRAMALAAAE